jgi:hypothetical protein
LDQGDNTHDPIIISDSEEEQDIVIPTSEVIIVRADTPHPIVSQTNLPSGDRHLSPPYEALVRPTHIPHVNEIVVTVPGETIPDHVCIGCSPPPEGYNADSDKENVPPNESVTGGASRPEPDTGETSAFKKHTPGENRRRDL